MTEQSHARRHTWRFFRAGGFDQVRLDSGADIAHLEELDQKLWVALACPTRGLEFDAKTLDLMDTDHDGRIRAPEVLAAAKWTCGMLKDPDTLTHPGAGLPLSAINDAALEGKQLLSSARQILVNLGKPVEGEVAITTEDTADTAKIFAQTRFNGDGIIPPDAADDAKLQTIINDIMACLGSETDRSGKAGINQAKVDLFFADAVAFASWQDQSGAQPEVMVLGANTAAAAAALKAVAAKVDDYFARCRLAAFDARALPAVNLAEDLYATVAGKSLSLGGAELAAFPLARVEAGRALPLTEGLNPGWRAAVEAFRAQVVKPLLGDKAALSEAEWLALVGKLAPFDGWLAAKAGIEVEKLGLARVREILGGDKGAAARNALTQLVAKDAALAPEAGAIAMVDQLVRYHRDLFKLLNNFVSFRDFYGRRDKSVFQAGTLYLDQRSCDLCVRVEDMGRHGSMAHLSYTYLTYCDVVRKSAAGGEKMTIAAAFTAGDSDNLMVGRNGVFYDRQGRDWDATIVKIIEHPISIRQSFWLPYKRLSRWIEEQVAKRAAAADANATTRLQGAATSLESAVAAPATPVPPPPKKMDVGTVAALGVALGALSTAFGFLLNWLANVPLYFIPVYIIGVMLLISMPSMILAALKLRQRNLGPILDANGWAVNAKAKINIPFGGSLTHIPKLPPGSHRDVVDPYAEKHTGRNWTMGVLAVLAVVLACWYFGLVDKVLPNVFPESAYMKRVEEARKKKEAAATQAAAVVDKAATSGPATTR